MKNKNLYCPFCHSKNLQFLFNGDLKCVNCKRTFPDKRKLGGGGVMSLLMVFACVIQVYYYWLQVTKSWSLGIPIYLIGVAIMSLGFAKGIMGVYRKNLK